MEKDLFSSHARQYAAFRPTYPASLFDFILSFVKEKNKVWDCATGNGQVARVLSAGFGEVFATDISQAQLDNAFQAPNIFYSRSPAEQTPFEENTFDLITVGQALHWFDFKKFFAEVRRVSKPDAILAVCGYDLLHVSAEMDGLLHDFYTHTVGSYWEPERQYVADRYANIPVPFTEMPAPDFEMTVHWTLDELSGYLSTWSSVQKFIRQNGYNPVLSLTDTLRSYWKTEERKEIIFPLFCRIFNTNHDT